MELRQVKRDVYTITVDGENVIRRLGDSGRHELLALFTTGMKPEEISKIQIVSHSMRNRRNRTFKRLSAYDRDNYLKEYYYPDYDSLELPELDNSDKYSSEPVSEILPDYRIMLVDIFPELYPVAEI